MSALRFVSTRGAAASYRQDVRGRGPGDSFGPRDGTWIEIASILEHAAQAEPDEASILIADAAELAESVVDHSALFAFEGPGSVTGGKRTAVESIQRFTQELEEAGCVNLAMLVLESLAASRAQLTALELGRISAQRARIMWKAGQVERARATYRDLERLGEASGEVELRVRAHIGYMAIAHLANDDQSVVRWGVPAVEIAEEYGFRQLARMGYNSLMVAAARTKQFDKGLLYGWRLYELAENNSVAINEVLLNFGQLLYDAGHPEPSRSAFAAVLSKTLPARIGLHALGGFALASAGLGDTHGVRWAMSELCREASRANAPLPAASAFYECATALRAIGDIDACVDARARSIALATAHGYKALAEKAARLKPYEGSSDSSSPVPCVLTRRASRVARRIGSLAPTDFPFRVSFIAAA